MDWRDYSARMALKFGPALLIILSFSSIFLGVIYNAITIDEVKFRDPPARDFDPNIVIGDQPNDLLWFLQVTDLHISNRGHKERITDFNEFTRTYLDIVKPDLVLVTGDITDGRNMNSTFGSGPQIDEWKAYSNAIHSSNATSKTAWLDVRGNHDNFNVYRPRDPNNLYRRFSIQGNKHDRNYIYTHEKGGKNYSFIGVDEVQTPGLKMIFNFLGIVNDDDLEALQQLKKLSRERQSQYNVWFAHYPTSSIVSPNDGLRNMIDGPYLCGHFHTIANLVLKMHATQQQGYVELELGDWKNERQIRLAAIDHQLFSADDFKFRAFPIALMTNPKGAELSMPKIEPLGRILNSTHIRVIAFSNVTLIDVKLSIDGKPNVTMKHSGGPLYTHEWNPEEYSKGLHRVMITVADREGKILVHHQTFSLDNSKDEFPLGARILLRVRFKTIVMSIFFFLVGICTLPMLTLRIVKYKHQDSGLRRHYRGTFLYNYHLLSSIPSLFWPLLLIPLWLSIGPLFIGFMVEDHLGACFVWGVLVDGTYIQTGLTYHMSSIFLLLLHIPESILLTYQVSYAHKHVLTSSTKPGILNLRLLAHALITLLQIYIGSLLMYSAYGFLAFLTSFPFTWCAFIYAYCWYRCCKIEKSDFVSYCESNNQEEQQSLTTQRARDDKSNASDQ